MPSESAPATSAFKEWFNVERYRQIAADVAAIEPGFDRKKFLALTLEGLETRELMDRLRQTAIALGAALPGKFPRQLETVRSLAPKIGHNFVNIALCDFVARFGLRDPERSLEALRDLTRYGSAEFAIRPFLQQDLHRTLAVMRHWTEDANEHVRRLASEGSRPRLPWGQRLLALIADPSPTSPIREALKADPSLYVRKSVANHLNDISKDHPEHVLAKVSAWDASHGPTAWIIRHGLRTLIKRGDSRALALLGSDAAAATHVRILRFQARPARLVLGQVLTLEVALQFAGAKPERLVVDYVVHYIKANGSTSPKVFKWCVATAAPQGQILLTKRQTWRDFTTRRHFPGKHRIELQVNGQRLAEASFVLTR